ncbi:MAG: hypothetical protein JSR11_03520 [Bacteroidetes bacterium]|nr:hypothetical protein [Bacteroidota bacterium]
MQKAHTSPKKDLNQIAKAVVDLATAQTSTGKIKDSNSSGKKIVIKKGKKS